MTKLKVQNFVLAVHLGCTLEERRVAQEVRISLELEFLEPPPACATDRLQDTVCYQKICEQLRALCLKSNFQTIERLGFACLEEVRSILPNRMALAVQLHKVSPPIEGLQGGVVFEHRVS